MSTKGKPQSIDDLLLDLRSLAENIPDPEDKLMTECMVVLISALAVGTNVDRLVKQTGYPRKLIEAISIRMHEVGLWIGDIVDGKAWFDQRGDLTADFYRHAMVAKGEFLREWVEDYGFLYFDDRGEQVPGDEDLPSYRSFFN